MIFERITKAAPPGTVIPKPQAKKDFVVKGFGNRRNEKALIYFIPNHKDQNHPHQKGVTVSEFEKSYRQLLFSGQFTRNWFENNLPACNLEGGCNFTTIGGLFELIGEARYAGEGIYNKT